METLKHRRRLVWCSTNLKTLFIIFFYLVNFLRFLTHTECSRRMRYTMFGRFYNMLGSDIGIDLGTANTLVYLRDHGIIINEPSVVAVNQKTNRVVAVGTEAKQMLGRTPGHVVAVRPMVDGVISDFEVTEEMLAHFMNKAQRLAKKQGRPRVVIGIPSSITNVETRAVRDAAMNAGAREVFIVEEPMAA